MYDNITKDSRFLQIQNLLQELKKDYNLTKKDILDLSEDIRIPILLFKSNLSSFELIVKYLVETKNYRHTDIARITNRSKQGVWQAYNHSKNKFPDKFSFEKSKYDFPVSIIQDKKVSILESIVKYLKEEYNLSYAKISRLIKRDQRTVWTVYKRAIKKCQ